MTMEWDSIFQEQKFERFWSLNLFPLVSVEAEQIFLSNEVIMYSSQSTKGQKTFKYIYIIPNWIILFLSLFLSFFHFLHFFQFVHFFHFLNFFQFFHFFQSFHFFHFFHFVLFFNISKKFLLTLSRVIQLELNSLWKLRT